MAEPKSDQPEKPLHYGRYRHIGRFVQAGNVELAWAILDEPPSSPTRALHIHQDGTPAYAERFGYTGDFIEGRARVRKEGLYLGRGTEPEEPARYFYILPDGRRVE
jgi:hypothetical protein